MKQPVKEKINTLPLSPGVYIYKNSQGDIIYIGKAKVLKKRVSSYFSKNHVDKTLLLVGEISDMEYIVTDTEVEALILEARMIRENKPKYNIDLKNGIRYAYLQLTNDAFPRLLTIRSADKKKGKVYGPYTDGTARESSARLLRSIFRLRTCGEKLPNKVCLQYYLGNCDAPCVGHISKEDYGSNVHAVESVLKGRTKRLTAEIEMQMKEYSRNKNYELAKIRRDQVKALQTFSQRQKIDKQRSYNEDLLHFVDTGKKVYLQLFHLEKGQLTDRQEFIFDSQEGVVESFIRQYYMSNDIPDVLLVPKKLAEHELLQSYLTKLKEKPVRIQVPQKGEKKKLLEMVYKNALYATDQDDAELVSLRDSLYLTGVPDVIECFDISTIQGSYTVGAMVRFRSGQPDKSNYRRFKIKTVEGQDDFAAMAEIVKRRYSRLLAEKKELPNLVVIDGGKGQLSAAWQQMQALELNIPIIGLAKKEEEIYRIENSKPLRLSKRDPGIKLLIRLRDETHRFAVTYHRLLRGKGMKQ